jgi:hypothetical protein
MSEHHDMAPTLEDRLDALERRAADDLAPIEQRLRVLETADGGGIEDHQAHQALVEIAGILARKFPDEVHRLNTLLRDRG